MEGGGSKLPKLNNLNQDDRFLKNHQTFKAKFVYGASDEITWQTYF